MPSCDGKLQYSSKRKARDAGKRSSSRAGIKLYTYQCVTCHQWHLTKMPPDVYRDLHRKGLA